MKRATPEIVQQWLQMQTTMTLTEISKKTGFSRSAITKHLRVKGMDFLKGPAPKPVADRFWPKVNKDGQNGCWLWTANKNGPGYGIFRVGSVRDGTRRYVMAHRVAYELCVGPIPHGLQLDHLCRTPLCVNPDHLEPVTQGENIRRGLPGNPSTNGGALFNRAKTVCRNGHPYSEENTYVDPKGHRGCKICRRIASDRSKERRRAA